jgi:hypothetical protein
VDIQLRLQVGVSDDGAGAQAADCQPMAEGVDHAMVERAEGATALVADQR